MLAHSYESLVKVAIELVSVMFEVRLRDLFEAWRVMYYPVIGRLSPGPFFFNTRYATSFHFPFHLIVWIDHHKTVPSCNIR